MSGTSIIAQISMYLSQFHGANLILNSDVDKDTFGKVTQHKKTQPTRQPRDRS